MILDYAIMLFAAAILALYYIFPGLAILACTIIELGKALERLIIGTEAND